MNKEQAKTLIKHTFEASFDKENFTKFIKNLLNRIDESKAFHVRGDVKEMFRNVIKTYERIGTYNSPEGKKIDVIITYLQKGHSLDHARVTQRNFAGRYLADRGGKDAGLFAFVSPEESDWRFSLVKMDYKFEKTKTGKMKVKEELTLARRWSFLVGANEKSHTAQSQLVDILKDDEYDPILEEIEKAFDIETVTKEFFLKYRELFLRTKEELDRVVKNDPKIKDDFESKGVDTVNFAKKLLGQIIFLYFLQKKGWFGVGRDDDWGTGSKHFLRELFEKNHGDYKNFFNDILEPLFYEALRRDRSDDDGYYSRFNCKIPFLNGGLFDPIGSDKGYNWVDTDILLPDKLFSNTNKAKEGDIGTGILDIFDRYNFTVKEDEPLEKEVAIDPELLGKSYEKFNAIRPDNFEGFKKVLKNGRKGEENKFNKKFGVYYTPREIVHYMCQQSLINYLATELSSVIPSEARNLKEDIENLIHTGEKVNENEARVLRKGKETETYSHKLPESIRKNAKLIDEKLADITVCDPAVGSGAFPVGMMSEIVKTRNVLSIFLKDNGRTTYDFKRQCIEHSIYGVDIDPGAVEIAKLRLWLSLVVDEDDIKNIKPLPNLDYKVACGNSLLGVEKDLFNAHLFSELEKLKPLFFNETNPTKKQEYKKQIDKLISEITNGHTEFDFEVYFSEVFHNKGGFDVVIANPPYGIVYNNLKKLLEQKYISFKRNNDVYIAFYEHGINILKEFGVLTFITPNTFLNGDYFKQWRKVLTTQTMIDKILDFKNMEVFADPTVYVSVMLAIKKHEIHFPYKFSLLIPRGSLKNIQQKDVVEINKYSDQKLKVDNMIFNKIINLKGIGIFDNYFFVKDVGFNYWSKGRGKKRGGDSISRRVFYSGKKQFDGDIPFLKGRDIFKWGFKKPSNFLKKNYRSFLNTDIDTFRFSEDFLFRNPKIIYRQTANLIIAAIDMNSNYLDKTVHLVVPKEGEKLNLLYILALMNSSLYNYLYSFISQEEQGRAFSQVKTTYIKQFPVALIPKSEQKPFIDYVDHILSIIKDNDYLENHQKRAKVKDYERQIDQMVYKLYGLTDEEIKIIEGK